MAQDSYNLLIGNLWIPQDKTLPTTVNVQPARSTLSMTEGNDESNIRPQQPAVNIVTNTNIPSPIQRLQTTIQRSPPKVDAHHEPSSARNAGITTLVPTWQHLVNQIRSCDKCKLHHSRTHVVIERGTRDANWMFVGEGPGEQEDLQGKPFVGASGQLLDKMISAMQLDIQQEVYIANVVKCRPPKNRNPELEEIAQCSNYLKEQIALVKPQIIITLGRFAAQTILNSDSAVGKLRNKVHDYLGIPVIVTYHPSYLLRTPSAKRDSWQDLQLALKVFAERNS